MTMLTNKQIKRRELFILRNKLIDVNKKFKEAQTKFLEALNNCAVSEAMNEPKDKQKKVMDEFKYHLNYYFLVLRERFDIMLDIEKLSKWQAKEPKVDYENTIEQ